MAKISESLEGIRSIEFDSGAKLAYKGGDVEDILKNREALHTVLKLIKELNQSLDDKLEIERNGIKVISQPGLNVRKSKGRETFYYKVVISEQEYFLKRLKSEMGKEYGGGHKEFQSSAEAEALLKKEAGAEVVKYKMGYDSPDEWYFVSTWDPSLETTLEDYLKELREELKGTTEEAGQALIKYNKLMERVKRIEKILKPNFDDVFTYNMGYNPDTDKIVVFDLNKKVQETTRVD